MKILLILLTDLLIRIHIVRGDGCWISLVCDGVPHWRKITPCNQDMQAEAMKELYKNDLQEMTDRTAAMSNQLNDMRKMRELLESRTDETKTPETAIEDKVETTTHNIGTSAGTSETTSVQETLEQATQTTDRSMETTGIRFTGCSQVPQTSAKVPNLTSGVFDIYPNDYQSGTEVYCDTDGGGWTVFQRRTNGSLNFTHNWNDYVNGFGNLEGEFWMGLEKLHRLTSGKDFEVRFDLGDWEGNTAYAKYTTFSIGDASTKYRLNIGGYSGTAGDSMSYHNNMMFSTYDEDNDIHGVNCASTNGGGGGWWFRNCHQVNLNGLYLHGSYSATNPHGIEWYQWKGGKYSLKFTEMKFRPKL